MKQTEIKKIEIKKLGEKRYKVLIFLFSIFYSLFSAVYAESFKIEQVKPKIITPNDDNKNDMLIVYYLTDYYSSISGRILTLNGSFVSHMLDNKTDRITWDGKDGSNAVPSGIYIYQIETEGQIFNGTVVVAK